MCPICIVAKSRFFGTVKMPGAPCGGVKWLKLRKTKWRSSWRMVLLSNNFCMLECLLICLLLFVYYLREFGYCSQCYHPMRSNLFLVLHFYKNLSFLAQYLVMLVRFHNIPEHQFFSQP